MDIQEEIRILNSSVDLITNYINYSICSFPDDQSKLVCTVLPKNNTAKKYFYILLLELIAGVNKEIIQGKKNGENLLDLLERISINPKLDNKRTNIEPLKQSVENFQKWLDHEFEYKIYSQNISKNLTINLMRKDALYLIGNKCKHSLLRSNMILEKLLKIYRDSGVKIDTGTEILILEDIDNWLFDDFGGYHFTKLCELSSKVYYEIVHYLHPVYERSILKENNGRYSYKIPAEITKEESKFEFYELLNRIRSPFLPIIKTSKHLERKY